MKSDGKEKNVPFKGLLAALFYGVVSIAITFFNKAVLSVFDFHFSSVMTLCQMTFSIVLLTASRAFGLIEFPAFETKRAKRLSPLAISFVGMVLTGLAALRHLNVPMFSALRRVTTLLTMIGQYYVVGTSSPNSVKAAVLIMVSGSLVAGYWDLSYNAIGYFLVALNCVFTSLYLIFITKFGKQGLNSFGLMYYNNILSWPLVFLICFFTGELSGVMEFKYLYSPKFLFCFTIQAGLAFFLNYAIFLCTSVNSALATSITGQVKNILTTFVGYFIFGDVKYSFLNVVGLTLGVVGSVLYSYVKLMASMKKMQQLPVVHPNAGKMANGDSESLKGQQQSSGMDTAQLHHLHKSNSGGASTGSSQLPMHPQYVRSFS